MLLAGVLSVLVSVLATTFFFVRRWIDPACPACQSKQWTDVPKGIVCRSCGWSNLPVPVHGEQKKEAVAA
jgi:rubredoxin